MKKPVCIAHGGDLSTPSGGTDRVTALSSGLQERGHETHVVVPEPATEFPERLADVATHPVDVDGLIPGAIGRAIKIAKAAKRVANTENARLQLEHSTMGGVASFLGLDDFVLDMHDLAYSRYDHVDAATAPILKRTLAWLERRAAHAATYIVVVSDVMRDVLIEEWGVDGTDISVVPNGYFPERLEGVSDVETVDGRVCFLGTLHPKVDLDAFEAVAALSQVSELIVVGDGVKRAEFAARVADREGIRITGRLPDSEAFQLLASAEVAINPQHGSALQRSSSPVKLYYYAALGLPMVVAPGPSVVTDLVQRDAAVTAVGAEAVASAVGSLLENDGARKRLEENAQEASSGFHWERRIEAITKVYRRLSLREQAVEV